jgi:Ca2+-binding RTX toxin-like protein
MTHKQRLKLKEENIMATVVVGPAGEENGAAFPYNFLAIALDNATISLNSDATQATLTPDQTTSAPGYYDVVIGTNLNNQMSGVVTGFTVNDPNGLEYSATGLSINVGQLEGAFQIYQTDAAAGIAALQDIFSAVDWQIDFSDQTVPSEMFGTGGNDTITLGSNSDYLLIDGGSDLLDSGGGDDMIFAGSIVFTVTAGTSTVTGGEGTDTLALDFREFGEGSETVDFFGKGQKVDLNKGLLIIGEETVTFDSIENIRGSRFGDRLIGNEVANLLAGNEGNDTLVGNAGIDLLQGDGGKDKLTGGKGADHLTGGAGNDTFVYQVVGDSTGEKHDLITDFQHKHDKIDLRQLHPDTKHDKFVFIDDHKLKHAGDLQVIEHDNKGKDHDFTMVTADLDAKGHHQLEIELTGLVHLDAKDFLL